MDAAESIRILKDHVLERGDKDQFTDYDMGMWNGLEIALSFLENRPSFTKDRNKQYNPNTTEQFPEYFL